MSRRKRGGRRHSAKKRGMAPGAPVEGEKTLEVVNLSGFDAARKSARRGMVSWRTLDTSREVSPGDRMEIMRKCRAAEANIGIVKRAIGGLSQLVGTLRPQSKSGDAEFRKRAEEAFLRRASQPAAFDLAGKLDFEGWQDCVKRSVRRDGDALTVLAEGREGGGKVMFYEAHQVGDGKQVERMPENLRDGVYLDRWGGRNGFQLLNGEGERVRRVRREDGIYHCEVQRVGRPREISGMAHALSNVFDQMEILGFTKHAIKAASIWGAVLETKMESDGGAKVSEAVKAMWGGTEQDNAPAGNGKVITMEDITSGGRFHGLDPGQSIKTIQDTRPHPNILQMMAWLVRDIAWGVGVAPEVLWDASGLNGTSMRYVMAETRRWVENQQRILRRDCQRIWTYFLAKEMNAGRLERPADPEDRWWECEWIPQADLTIDEGRSGSLELAQREAGILSDQRFFAKRGTDWEEEYRQREIERKRKAEIFREVHGREPGEGDL